MSTRPTGWFTTPEEHRGKLPDMPPPRAASWVRRHSSQDRYCICDTADRVPAPAPRSPRARASPRAKIRVRPPSFADLCIDFLAALIVVGLIPSELLGAIFRIFGISLPQRFVAGRHRLAGSANFGASDRSKLNERATASRRACVEPHRREESRIAVLAGAFGAGGRPAGRIARRQQKRSTRNNR